MSKEGVLGLGKDPLILALRDYAMKAIDKETERINTEYDEKTASIVRHSLVTVLMAIGHTPHEAPNVITATVEEYKAAIRVIFGAVIEDKSL